MNRQVDGVVADYPVFAEIPIQGESQICYGTVKLISDLLGIFRLGEKSVRQGLRIQILYMQKMIIDNVGFVIKLPGGMKCI